MSNTFGAAARTVSFVAPNERDGKAEARGLHEPAFDIEYGLVKAASFGFAVTLIGCYKGLRARGGAEGVGHAATQAVVYSAVMILVLDAFWAMTWLHGRT